MSFHSSTLMWPLFGIRLSSDDSFKFNMSAKINDNVFPVKDKS